MFKRLHSVPGAMLLIALYSILYSCHVTAAEAIDQVLWSSVGGSTMRVEGDLRILEMQDNVRVTRGTLEITGDEAIFEYSIEDDELRRVSVFGAPVQYRQQTEGGELVTGSSETMLLYRDDRGESILEFRGNAIISSPDSTMRCSAIVYLLDQELIREATGPCQGSLSSGID